MSLSWSYTDFCFKNLLCDSLLQKLFLMTLLFEAQNMLSFSAAGFMQGVLRASPSFMQAQVMVQPGI